MKLDPQKTAFLTLDLQKGVFGLVPDSERVMPVAAKEKVLAYSASGPENPFIPMEPE
ncbi:MAG: hypothetical protein ABSF22_10665 [Bryobacteraceae bacterium]|jgi:hypothetical protein